MDNYTRQRILDYLESDKNMNNILYTERIFAKNLDLTITFEGMYSDAYSKHPFIIGQNEEQIKKLREGEFEAMILKVAKKYTLNLGKISKSNVKFSQWREPWTSVDMMDPNPGEFVGTSNDGIIYTGNWRGEFKDNEIREGTFTLVNVLDEIN